MEIKREQGESYLSFCQRVTNAVQDGLIDYDGWSEALLGGVRYSTENLRRCYQVVSQILQNADNDEIEQIDDMDKLTQIQLAMAKLKAERIKLQTTNLEYNAAQRAEARNDLFVERMVEAIGRLEPIKVERRENSYPADVASTMLITLSDFHAGSTFEIRGLYNEVVNRYDYDIMWRRLYNLIDQVEANNIECDSYTVAILGDCFENLIRNSSLLKLREPVIDTVIKFSEDMSRWLVELHNRLDCKPVNVVTVGGNHDVVRILESRPAFDDENLTKFVVAYMKMRLADADGIKIDDYQEVAVKNIRGTSVMFYHGEDKDLSSTMDYFSNLYNVDIDEIYGGHLHRPESKSIGITEVGDRLVNRVGSIVGVDTYAKKIRAASRPSAHVAIYTDDGKTWSRNYYL